MKKEYKPVPTFLPKGFELIIQKERRKRKNKEEMEIEIWMKHLNGEIVSVRK